MRNEPLNRWFTPNTGNSLLQQLYISKSIFVYELLAYPDYFLFVKRTQKLPAILCFQTGTQCTFETLIFVFKNHSFVYILLRHHYWQLNLRYYQKHAWPVSIR